MDKTLRRHKTKRHALYIDGLAQLAKFCGDDSKMLSRFSNQWLIFCIWSITKGGNELNSMSAVTRNHITRYGQSLKDEFLVGRYASTSTPSSNIATMNTLMLLARDGDWEKVRPIQDCGLEPHSYIPKKKLVLTDEGLPDMNSLAGYLLDLQFSLGVVIREALSLDLRVALREGRTDGHITVYSWRTGSRRLVPCRPSAIKALGDGIAARRLQKILPKHWEYDEYLSAHNKIAAKQGYSTNTARGVYIRERYQEITGISAPNISGIQNAEHIHNLAKHLDKSLSEAKRLDKHVRNTIAKEIGVLGAEFLASYLDKQSN